MPKRKNDIVPGMQFGRWIVLETNVYNPNSKAKTKILHSICQCTCEKKTISYVSNNNLRNGISKSCGCINSERLIKQNTESSTVKIGNKYGKLTVIADLGMRKQNSRDKNERWSLCQCDCGSEPIEVKNNMLQSGWKKSCGCLQSQGEFVIENIFKQNNIQYIKEYKFDDLVGKNNGKLRFDFAVFVNQNLKFLLEFDGKQHYTGPEATWKCTHSLEEIQEYDKLKNEYCKKNNILLKRIPYYDIKTIDYETIMSDKYNVIEDIRKKEGMK